MAIFDQRSQKVSYQYNAAGDINFGAVQNRVELVQELEKLKAELGRAREAQVIDVDTAQACHRTCDHARSLRIA